MPTLTTVNVTYNSVSRGLMIDSSDITIGEDGWVLWRFGGDIPPGCVGHIFFPEDRFGPFESLRLLDSKLILGMGKVGISSPRTYSYTALVLDASGAPAYAEGGSITNSQESGNTSPDVLVECFFEDNLGRYNLDINPSPLYLYTGDTATWHVLHIPEGHFVTLAFYNNSDTRLGPFETFSQGRALAGALPGDQFLAIGAGFGLPPTQAQLQYTIELRDAEGNLVAKQDPMIDNLGDPPTGGG
jgi:hypothetical protein